MSESFEKTPLTERNYLTRDDFNEQFKVPQTLTTPEGTLTYYKVSPEALTTDIPVLYVGGFATGPLPYEDTLFDIAKTGRTVIFTNPIKGFERTENHSFTAIQEQFGIADVVIQKALALNALLATENAERVDLISHSQGGLLRTVVCAQNPARVRKRECQSCSTTA